MENTKCKKATELIKEYSLKKAIKQKQQEDVAKARGFKSNKDFQDHIAQKKRI